MLDFDLGDEPSVTVHRKAHTKSRKQLVIPLRHVTAELLRAHFGHKAPAAAAFDIPRADETADMLRKDLAAARASWIEAGPTPEDRAKRAESCFLADLDAEGRRIDFHALRTTCGSWLDQAGVAASIAKRITGHASEHTLQRHYHRSTREQARRAVEAMPDIPLRATGTEDPQPKSQQRQHETQQPRATSRDGGGPQGGIGEVRKHLAGAEIDEAPHDHAGLRASEGDETRTRNLRIDSPML